MFPGSSCFPLTPDTSNKKHEKSSANVVSIDDQLIKILSVLGKQDKESMSFVQEDSVKSYCQSISKEIATKSIDKKLSKISTQMRGLLMKFLVFNPNQRLSAEEIL